MSKFVYVDDNKDAKAIAILRVFSENSRANKNIGSKKKKEKNIIGKAIPPFAK